jgi:multiple sugar transport system ATP-binding protein
MRDGFLQQVAPPMELYREPANRFVAGFVGSPAMNFLPGDLVRGLGRPSADGILGVRPHEIIVVQGGAGDLDALVDVVEPRGSDLLVYLRLGSRGEGPEVKVIAPPETSIEAGKVVGLRFDRERLHWFDLASGKRLSL